jgi:hypothetical protein
MALVACAAASYVPGADMTCAANGMKCAGEAGRPLYPYKPCCSSESQGIQCAKKKTYTANEWGMFCVSKDQEQKKSYNRYERCMGATGYPRIKFLPCNDADVCFIDPKRGWGAFCLPRGEATIPPPMTQTSGKKDCYKSGERCLGTPGKPAVEHMRTCDPALVCREEPILGWGKFVLNPKPVSSTPTESANASPASEKRGLKSQTAPVATKLRGGCYQSGERCAGAPGKPAVPWKSCCNSGRCEQDSSKGWGSFCRNG